MIFKCRKPFRNKEKQKLKKNSLTGRRNKTQVNFKSKEQEIKKKNTAQRYRKKMGETEYWIILHKSSGNGVKGLKESIVIPITEYVFQTLFSL